MTTIVILKVEIEKKNYSTKDIDETVERVLELADYMTKEFNLEIKEGEYLPNATSLKLK